MARRKTKASKVLATVAKTSDDTARTMRDAVECIDGAIIDIVDSWSLRDTKPDGACLMSALADLRQARDLLAPREGKMANRGAS